MEKHFIQNSDLEACFKYILSIYNSRENKKPNDSLDIDHIEWASSPYYNIYPLSIELNGMKRGRLYKKPPKNLGDVVSYGFFKNDLVLVRYYDSFQKTSVEYIFKYTETQIIVLGYVYNKIKRVHCIMRNNSIPQYSLHLIYEDNNYKRFYKQTYSYDTLMICQIYEHGFIFNKNDKIGIIDVNYDIEYCENIVSKIVAKMYNHRIGKFVSDTIFNIK